MEYVATSALSLCVGIVIGYYVKKVRYYTYNPPNLTHRYTYNEIIKFAGGSPVRRKGAICGSRNTAIIIDNSVLRSDNTIYFSGSFHIACSPANPGHQSLACSTNKRLNETRAPIYIFVKIRSNEYAFIGTGLRNGSFYTVQKNGRNVIIFPIRYMSGNLNIVMKVLEAEICSNSSDGSD